MNLKRKTSSELLAIYSKIIDELKEREVIRTRNNPASDYAELLVSRALGLSLMSNSNAGYDAISDDGIKYQIKARRISKDNRSKQLSVIRDLNKL